MNIEKLKSTELDKAQSFYSKQGYTSTINQDDFVLVAKISNDIIGIVRVSNEENIDILRGMFIAEKYQRKGIGKKMLVELSKIFGAKEMYCIPFRHLEKFYGTMGFKKIEMDKSPYILQSRLLKYINQEYDCIVMKKLSIQ